MAQFWQQITAFKYFKEVAFLVALVLLVWAWKNGVEGLIEA